MSTIPKEMIIGDIEALKRAKKPVVGFLIERNGKYYYDITDETFRRIVRKFKPSATEKDFEEIRRLLAKSVGEIRVSD